MANTPKNDINSKLWHKIKLQFPNTNLDTGSTLEEVFELGDLLVLCHWQKVKNWLSGEDALKSGFP